MRMLINTLCVHIEKDLLHPERATLMNVFFFYAHPLTKLSADSDSPIIIPIVQVYYL